MLKSSRSRAAIEAVERRVLLSTVSGQIYNDFNANGAHDPGEPGLSGVVVYLDQNNNGQFDGDVLDQEIPAQDVPKPIPDATDTAPSSVDSVLNVNGLSGAVTQVTVTLDITHAFDSDLQVTLISPSGRRVLLIDQVGNDGQNFTQTTLDDTAIEPILGGTAPFTGVYRPTQPLSVLNGEDPNGTWKLEVTDTSPGDTGTLNGWTLGLSTGEPNTLTDANGNYTLSNLPTGSYNVQELVPTGFAATNPPGGSLPVTLDGSNAVTGADFGNHQPPGVITGTKYEDLNNNGRHDPGEPGLPGWTIYLDANGNGTLDPGEVSTVTDSTGSYSLAAPVGGTYTVAEVPQPGWMQTQPGFSLSVGRQVNVSQKPDNQSEGAIAIDPTNPNHMFMVSNEDSVNALFMGYSTDGGTTWTTRDGANGKDIPAACCDPSVSFDSYGNLFLSYIDTTLGVVEVARSENGGKSFSLVKSFTGDVDQPTLTTGPGSVWVTWNEGGNMVATSAVVSGLGVLTPFSPLETVTGGSGSFGDIAVGPDGQVMVTWQDHTSDPGPAKIYESVDPDGTGPEGFGRRVLVTTTNVGGFDNIPPQAKRSVDAEAGLAWDRSTGPHRGRVYLVYTDESPATGSGNTDIFVRTSDDEGATWSQPVRVNDDSTQNAQFMPRIALDQTSGSVAVSWYDARNDSGSGPGDTDGKPNTDVQFYATASFDGGQTFLPNLLVGAGTTNAAAATNDIQLGDYTGLAFYNGRFFPVWSDNSNSTGDNPDGRLHNLDMYTAAVSVLSGANARYTITAGPGHDATGVDFGNRQVLPGDANADGKVDFSDLLILAQNYGQRTGRSVAAADFNNDGKVDFSDLLILAQNYGKNAGKAATTLASSALAGPVPATAASTLVSKAASATHPAVPASTRTASRTAAAPRRRLLSRSWTLLDHAEA